MLHHYSHSGQSPGTSSSTNSATISQSAGSGMIA